MSENPNSEKKRDVIWDAKVEMEDGVGLSSDIFLPSRKEESHPTILIRTPYVKSSAGEIEHGTRDVNYFVRNGYAVVIQDVRGRGDSEGEWVPFVYEAKDGARTIEWLAEQPWCSGEVGMMGGSYRGYVQWAAAKEGPSALTTMVSTAAAGKWFQELPFINGAVTLIGLGWLNLTGGRTVQNPDPINWEDIFWHLPIKSMDEKLGRENTVWKEWLSHSTFDDYWKKIMVAKEEFRDIDIPALHITGWYDGDQPGAMYYYQNMTQKSPAGGEQFLVAGPWNHGGTRVPKEKLGGVDFTENSKIDLKELHLLWFDAKLKGEKKALHELEGFFEGGKAKTFAMGENNWKKRIAWPPSVEMDPWYLHSSGNANTLKGDGELRPASSDSETFDSYKYDPADPVVPEVDFNFYSESHTTAPLDQRFVERRDDVLVFTSDLLDEKLEIAGKPKAVLYASSDQVDTDWVVLISDVFPDGKSIKLTEGYLRARYRNSLEEAQLLEPGNIYEYSFEMNYSVNNTFQPGHRVRVSITSSYFPEINRNPNTGAEIGEGEQTEVAEQKIYHGIEHPSRILLPRVNK